MSNKIYCIRKYIKAESALDAIQKERHTPVHEIFIDDGWMRNQVPNLNKMMDMPIQVDDSEPTIS